MPTTCPTCEAVFESVAEWQRHNLREHMVHASGSGPLPEERTEAADAESGDAQSPDGPDSPSPAA
jgi:hypothetical protein